VYALIPNVKAVQSRLEKFCKICEADEVVLFEKATFLVISHATRPTQAAAASASSSALAKPSLAPPQGPDASSSSALAEFLAAPTGGPSAASTANVAPPSKATSLQVLAERDPHRFEKISNIIKQFKLSCSKTQAQFTSMEVRNSHFSAFISEFTANTYVMVVLSDPSIRSSLYTQTLAELSLDPYCP